MTQESPDQHPARKFQKGLYNAGYFIGLGLATVFLAAMALALLTHWAFIPANYQEYAYFRLHGPSFYIGLVVAGAVLFGLGFILRKLKPTRVALVLGAVWTVLTLGFVGQIKPHARADAAIVIGDTLSIINGDYSDLAKGRYLSAYPHQLGAVTIQKLLFGDLKVDQMNSAISKVYVTNVFATLVTILALWLAVRLWTKGDVLAQNYALVLGFSFTPLMFYVIFPYNVAIGLGFVSLGVVIASLLFVRDHMHPALKAAVLVGAGLCFGLGIMIRSNFLILVVGLVLITVLSFVRTLRWDYLALVAVVVIGVVAIPALNKAAYEDLEGANLDNKMPNSVWIDMGLSHEKTGDARPGWFGIVQPQLYYNSGGDVKAADEQAKQHIHQDLQDYKNDPIMAGRFFWQKFRSTWIEPSLESIWVGPVQVEDPVMSSDIARDLYKGGDTYNVVLKHQAIGLAIIYLSALLAGMKWLQRWRKRRPEIIYLPFIFMLGGALFHLVWETKSQYIYPQVTWLIPIAAIAWSWMFKTGVDRLQQVLRSK